MCGIFNVLEKSMTGVGGALCVGRGHDIEGDWSGG